MAGISIEECAGATCTSRGRWSPTATRASRPSTPAPWWCGLDLPEQRRRHRAQDERAGRRRCAGAHVFGNTITASTNRAISPPPPSERLDLPVGAGVWVGGASFAVVERNEISASSYGVVVTGPAFFDRIVANTVSESVEADLAWDGIGANRLLRGKPHARGGRADERAGDGRDPLRLRAPGDGRRADAGRHRRRSRVGPRAARRRGTEPKRSPARGPATPEMEPAVFWVLSVVAPGSQIAFPRCQSTPAT